MKYELIGKNNILEPIETVLRNRGIEDIQSFFNISEKDTIHWSKLRNMDRAVDCLLGHVKKGSKVFVQTDSDPDGYTSAATLIDYLKKAYPTINLVWRLHEGKEHGIILKTIPDDADLVIIPDAGSNQFKEHKTLKEKGIDVIVLDHHDCDRDSEDAIVVNSQLSPEYHNKQFSGVGITYKFCKALDERLNLKMADNYLDLVAIGNIADSQDMRIPETRYYVDKGLKKIKNKLLKALYDKQTFSTKGIVNIKSTEFYINPLMNACIRVGTMEEKTQMMKALLGSDETIYYKRKDIYEPIEVNTARLLGNIKNRQGKLRDKGVELIEEKIEGKNLLQNKLLIVDVTNILDKNLTGLVANKLKDKYKRGTLLVRYNTEKEVVTGSIRGYDKGELKDLKLFLQKLKLFDFVEGHANAAGLQIKPEKLIEANEKINELLKDIETDTSLHDVDFIISSKQLKKQFIKDIHKHQDLWGHQLDEPLLAIKDVEVNRDEIYLNGKTTKTLKFESKGIEYIKFFSSESEWIALKDHGERLVLDVVGKCSVNEWNGETKSQIVIEDYAVTQVKKKQILF
ncbi:DHH family phosphoesterase [Bacillus sp. UMB0728]|uniref:DHH family phosphoesterase n=1 Tax=Bacillus sp. UMB0728 TaxID=2066052 RepID=UPI000C755D6F|nr:DHH family phosphoesterase [Bacillus sp. UMB0728]PLR72191.1 single-stranded-DNA-specific exonuclease RecJ [Bacillus sp. UMB0728]